MNKLLLAIRRVAAALVDMFVYVLVTDAVLDLHEIFGTRVPASATIWAGNLLDHGSFHLQPLGVLVVVVFYFGYFGLFERFTERSIGKYIFGLRVIGSARGRIPWHSIFVRGVFRLIDLIPVLFIPVGLISMWLDPRNRTLGDRVADTIVISDSPIRLRRWR